MTDFVAPEEGAFERDGGRGSRTDLEDNRRGSRFSLWCALVTVQNLPRGSRWRDDVGVTVGNHVGVDGVADVGVRCWLVENTPARLKIKCSSKTRKGVACPNFACHGETRCRSHGGESQGRLICTCDRFSFAHEPGHRCEQPVLRLIPRKSGGKTVEQSAEPFPTPTIPSPREALAFRAKLVAEQAAARAEPEVPEEELIRKRLAEIALELEQVGTEYKNISYLEGVTGRMRLLDKIGALELERDRLKTSGWPKSPKPAAQPPAREITAHDLLGGGGWGAISVCVPYLYLKEKSSPGGSETAQV